ncbi:origin recognition complex subunit 4 [Cryptotrichosporon argae]
MPKRKAAASSGSPDPLALPDSGDMIVVSATTTDAIGVEPHTPSTHAEPPASTLTTPKRPRPVVSLASKRTPTVSPAPRAVRTPNGTPTLESAKRARTARTASGKRAAPATATARASARKEDAAIPEASPATPARRGPRATLASALRASPLVKGKDKDDGPLPSFDDDVFGSPAAPGVISDAAFRANEALRRQREARNFVFQGDASAPKLTRSGRVIGTTESEREDAYGAADRDGHVDGDETGDGDETFVAREEVVERRQERVERPVPTAQAVKPLLNAARPLVLRMLSTLTGQPTAEPILDEDKSEALAGLVGLLKGTVERGEGNSALLTGARGVGKSRTVARALSLLPSTSGNSPIVVRLSGLAQTNDRLAIREMGRQIAEAEGKQAELDDVDDEEAEGEEYAPTTLPSHLLALLTAPSPRAIIIIIDEFDLFTEHARQALLYCLLDVVQSIKTGPVETTGRGVAVVGITTRVDTLLLLEKRVKSRFSHRVWRVASPLTDGWRPALRRALVAWDEAETERDKALRVWKDDWMFAVDMLLDDAKIKRGMDRLTGLTPDVRLAYRPFIEPIAQVLAGEIEYMTVPHASALIVHQVELAGWGLAHAKLRGLSQPALGVLVVAKHLAYAGRDDFNFAQVEDEYVRFARTRLVGSGKVRWPVGVVRTAFDHLCALQLLAPAGKGRVRCVLGPHEVVAYFKGEGGALLGPELVNWARTMGGHV